jgi:putative chitinase
MRFNREIFFDRFKVHVLRGNRLSQSLVNAFNDLLDEIERDTYLKSKYDLAYMLGTAWHETAFTMRPIKERGGKAYFIRNYWKKVKVRNQLGNKSEYDAWARSGRGFVQLTGLSNDIKMTSELRRNYPQIVRDFENRTKQTFDLVKNPEQALDPKIAYAVMVIGMTKGIFTGKGLPRYISPAKNSFKDYKEARRVVNGQDKAAQIANYAIAFEAVIDASLINNTTKPIETPLEEEIPEVETPLEEGAEEETQTEETTSVEVTEGGGVKVETVTSSENSKVAIEKPEATKFSQRIWKKIVAVFGGNVTLQTVADYGQQGSGTLGWLGLSPMFWKILIATALIGSLIWLAMEFFKWKVEQRRNLEITNKLLEANGVDASKAVLVDKDRIDEFKNRGYSIIYR